MKVSVKDGAAVLAEREEDYGGRAVDKMVTYQDLAVNDGILTVKLDPKNTGTGTDVQVSWIAVARNTLKPVITLNGLSLIHILP